MIVAAMLDDADSCSFSSLIRKSGCLSMMSSDILGSSSIVSRANSHPRGLVVAKLLEQLDLEQPDLENTDPRICGLENMATEFLVQGVG